VANDLIYVDNTVTTAVYANELKNAVEAVRTAREKIKKIQGWMVHSFAGSDYSTVETRFGIATGLGDDVFLLIDGSLQAMDGTSSGYINDLIARVG
jgi:hypothetical protein